MDKNSEIVFNAELDRTYSELVDLTASLPKDFTPIGEFLESLKQGNATMSLKRGIQTRSLEIDFIEVIEKTLPAIDMVVRKYSVGIEEREEILPIEFSKNITSRSIRHLAQHTDFIVDIKDDMITPSKILNVFTEETMMTYENKFVNTLINRLYIFVDKIFSAVKDGSKVTDTVFTCEGDFHYYNNSGKITFSIENKVPEKGEDASDILFNRLNDIYAALVKFQSSPFVVAMRGQFVRPPIMRTNAISKNKYLRQCLDLWDYIESYEKLGYVINTEFESAEPDDVFIQKTFALLSAQYNLFLFNFEKHKLIKSGTEEDYSYTPDPIEPELVADENEIIEDEFKVYETQYKKMYKFNALDRFRRHTADEWRIKEAVSLALEQQEAYEAQYLQKNDRKNIKKESK